MAQEILLVPHNHFDPTWRRCFDRPAKAHGVTLTSYLEVETLCIDRFLELAPQGYPFSDGQVAIWRKYLANNPEQLEPLRRYAEQGLLDVMLAGETVSDTNLPSAEGLVRNFLVAMPIYRALVGENHRGLKLGWVEDTFGNGPNYPQILRGVGADAACNTSYHFCPDDVWVGIDGTKIRCYDNHPAVRVGAFAKHAPCPVCRGRRCAACDRTGMSLLPGFELPTIIEALEKAAEHPGDWVDVFILTEEVLPDPKLFEVIEAFNRKHAGGPQVKLANPSDIYARYLPVMDAALAARDEAPTPELNPAMPGCYVTRIKCKQRTRSVAYELIGAEAAIADASWKRAKPQSIPADFAQAWQGVTFNQFHDAITGTHIDSAYVELMDMLDDAQAVALPYLPKKKTAPAQLFRIVKSDAGSKKLGELEVKFDRIGIVSILCNGVDVFGTYPGFTRFKRPLRTGELLLDVDFGDAWGQRIATFVSPERNTSQIPLGDFNKTVEISSRAIRWKGSYRGGDPKVKKLRWTITASASADGKRIDFVTEVDWDTESRRLRVIVPVQSQSATATYEVPFGFIDRTYDAAKLDFSQWRAHSMEFPALHWARAKISTESGVAVLNKGLPCYRWMPGRFDLSLLRSPEWQFCAVEPGNYEFWDIDGQRDTGRHKLEYSLWPYTTGLSDGDLTRAGYAYNLPRAIEPPFEISGDVVVTAWKSAEDGDGWILRLQNATGAPTDVEIRIGKQMKITRTNLLETPQDAPVISDVFQSPLHKHGILTLLLQNN